MDIEMRAVTPEEVGAYITTVMTGLGRDATEEDISRQKPMIEFDRTLAVFDEGEIVGTAGAISLEMTVPGGSLPLAGVMACVVLPTHRRRGIFTQLMERQLRDIHERGEALAALGASESIIYGRFGYGMASLRERWTIERYHTAFAHSPELGGRVVLVEPERAKEVFPVIYERVCSQRLGMVKRGSSVEWDRRTLLWDLFGGGTSGYSRYMHAVYERDGRPDGYVIYRTNFGEQRLRVYELMAATDEAHAALWQFCFGVDLMTTTEALNRPVDDPLLWMLADPRLLRRSPSDGTWLRLVDVAAALSARGYGREERLRFDVQDPLCPWNRGRLELEAGPDGALCRSTSESPDLVLSAADLAAVYLGAVRFRTLAQAARVQEETPRAISRADAMFVTRHQPWCAHGW